MNRALRLPLAVAPALPEAWPAAFQMLFQDAPRRDRKARIANAMELARTGQLESEGVLVAHEGERLIGVLVCLPIAGAAGLIWPPQTVRHPRRPEVENRLLERGLGWLRGRGAKLAHALLTRRELIRKSALERNGFAHVTQLWYMRHRLAGDAFASGCAASVELRTFLDCDPDLFCRTLLETYQETMDCPEIHGVRTIDEILAGHRAQGVHHPEQWWLAFSGDHPVGVLLLAEMPDWHAWDISYVGVIPAARRRAIGRQLVAHAIKVARAERAVQLTLSVDARNHPAWRLYQMLGFEEFDRREVFLRSVEAE